MQAGYGEEMGDSQLPVAPRGPFVQLPLIAEQEGVHQGRRPFGKMAFHRFHPFFSDPFQPFGKSLPAVSAASGGHGLRIKKEKDSLRSQMEPVVEQVVIFRLPGRLFHAADPADGPGSENILPPFLFIPVFEPVTQEPFFPRFRLHFRPHQVAVIFRIIKETQRDGKPCFFVGVRQ